MADTWQSPHGRALPPIGERLLWMGIINATPDSFSDGGRYLAPEAARARALELAAQGADMLDIGAESTRPGFTPVDVETECARLLPVLDAVRAALPDMPISVDTMKAETARRAIAAGADIVNDIAALMGDADMAACVAQLQCPVVLMHNRATPVADGGEAFWDALFADMRDRVERACAAGIADAQIVLDIGIGFGKTRPQQLECLRRCERLRALGYPLLLGISRKSALVASAGSAVSPDEATAVGLAWALARGGADIARVHEVGFLKARLSLASALAYPKNSATV